jgi:hypothetical protein
VRLHVARPHLLGVDERVDPGQRLDPPVDTGKVEPTPKTLTYNVRAVRGGS